MIAAFQCCNLRWINMRAPAAGGPTTSVQARLPLRTFATLRPSR